MQEHPLPEAQEGSVRLAQAHSGGLNEPQTLAYITVWSGRALRRGRRQQMQPELRCFLYQFTRVSPAFHV